MLGLPSSAVLAGLVAALCPESKFWLLLSFMAFWKPVVFLLILISSLTLSFNPSSVALTLMWLLGSCVRPSSLGSNKRTFLPPFSSVFFVASVSPVFSTRLLLLVLFLLIFGSLKICDYDLFKTPNLIDHPTIYQNRCSE
ncbi:hypothetical protein O6H91_16G028800 [Diphasiastrum complanatum]|uniref:Uncharacterized protein n=1 Tax=Diphasiastrum complanatum TaxID=34168 RepID=A0ACC2BB35_DIPCM|nr:hypothetical protein O6H91_16G028800 [Diphasiastrum complanatum]